MVLVGILPRANWDIMSCLHIDNLTLNVRNYEYEPMLCFQELCGLHSYTIIFTSRLHAGLVVVVEEAIIMVAKVVADVNKAMQQGEEREK